MKSIKDKAMIINLSISQWSGRKYDRKITHEVNTTHGTKDAGRFNKILVSKDSLRPLATLTSRIRSYHMFNTLPWGDNGDRLLPAYNYFKYYEGFRKLRKEFDELADEFANEYPFLIEEAEINLNGMFNQLDYPPVDNIRNRFSVGAIALPVPDKDDFRFNIPLEGEVEILRNEMGVEIENRHAAAVGDLLKRVSDAVRVAKKAVSNLDSKSNARFHSSLLTNIEKLVDVIPSLNYTDNPKVAKAAEKLKGLMYDSSVIKSDPAAREDFLAKSAKLEKLLF